MTLKDSRGRKLSSPSSPSAILSPAVSPPSSSPSSSSNLTSPPPLPSTPSPLSTSHQNLRAASTPATPSSPSASLLKVFSGLSFPSLRIEDTKPLSSIEVVRDEKKDLFAMNVMPAGQRQVSENGPETHWHFVQVEGKGEDGLLF
ncbi:hypothetical protein M1146_05405 [Patescibacteria group bacterium]|nr:hypothetical protein [Patescibacteria group bacterium]